MLTAYRITYADGTVEQTNMAANVTLEDARQYFSGKWFDLVIYPEERLVKAVNVERIA